MAAAVLSAAATVVVLVGSAVPPAAADPVSGCSAKAGVLVAVDFTTWQQPIYVGCDSTLTNGYDALYAAGFITTGTAEDGPDFVCRIGLASDGAPAEQPTGDQCVDTPPPTAYWSYWHADNNTWSYSQQGAMNYVPPAGGIDAWVFGSLSGSSAGPSFTPDQVRSAADAGGTSGISPAPPAPTTTTTVAATTGPGSTPTSSVTAAGAHPAGTGPRTTTPTTNAATGSTGSSGPAPKDPPAGRSPTTSTTHHPSLAPPARTASGQHPDADRAGSTTASGSSRSDIMIVGAPAATSPRRSASTGPPVGFIAGAGAVVVLGGSAALVTRRRRQAA